MRSTAGTVSWILWRGSPSTSRKEVRSDSWRSTSCSRARANCDASSSPRSVVAYRLADGVAPEATPDGVKITPQRRRVLELARGMPLPAPTLAREAGVSLPWTPDTPTPDDAPTPPRHPAEDAVGLRSVREFFPLLDTAIRRRNGTTIAEHTARIGRMWSNFSLVAAANPYAEGAG